MSSKLSRTLGDPKREWQVRGVMRAYSMKISILSFRPSYR